MTLAVLAATLVDVVDFFPVTLLFGVSKFLFSALALAFCISLMVSFVVAMTVIPLFCSRFLKAVPHAHGRNTGAVGEIDSRHESVLVGALQRRIQPRSSTGCWMSTRGCVRRALSVPA